MLNGIKGSGIYQYTAGGKIIAHAFVLGDWSRQSIQVHVLYCGNFVDLLPVTPTRIGDAGNEAAFFETYHKDGVKHAKLPIVLYSPDPVKDSDSVRYRET